MNRVAGRGVAGLVGHWCRHTPDACAVRDPATGEELSYAGLWGRTERLAAELIEAGVLPGDVVATGLGRSVGLVVAMLGIVRAGAVYLPLDEHAPPARRAGMLRDSRARVVVVAARGDAGKVREVVVPQDMAAGETLPEPGGNDPVYVMYTSGSTGEPKGVVVPHRAVRRLVVKPSYCTVAPGDRIANGSNPAFDASTFEIWGALAAGATVVVFPAVTDIGIENWETLVRTERITAAFLTTSLFHLVAQERPGSFAALRTLVVGGEQLELAAVRRVLAAGGPTRLVNGYGPTEATTFAASFDCTADSLAGRDRIPVGFPLQGTELYVLDERSEPVPDGTTGELWVGGPGVALGYLNRPDLTAERFVADERRGMLYRTGDLARRHPDGTFEVLGRRDRQVKLRGFRIEPAEIERAATATGIVDAAYVEKVGEGAAATLVGFGLSKSDVDGARLSRLLAERLPAYLVPSRWVTVHRLPLGPTGKVDRVRLLALLDEPVPDDGASEALAEQVRELCRAVLGVSSLSYHDNLLELGGNSITALRLSGRIEAQLGIAVEPAEILLADSLAELIARLRPAGTVRTAP